MKSYRISATITGEEKGKRKEKKRNEQDINPVL